MRPLHHPAAPLLVGVERRTCISYPIRKMNSPRYALAVTMLAVCQLVQAQTEPLAQPVVPTATGIVEGASASAVAQPATSSPPITPAPTQPPSRVEGEKPQASATVSAEAKTPPAAASAEQRIIRGTGQVIAPPKGMPPLTGAPVSFRFEEAPVAEVVRTVMGDILKVDYVMHPPLQGTVTLATRAPIPPDQAVFLLESALQANGLALVRDARGTFHAGRADALKNVAGSIRQFSGSNPSIPPGYGAVIIPLQYIGAGEMASILRPMVAPEAIVRVDTVRNLLVMMGTRTQAEGWMDLVNTFDVDLLKGMSVGVFPLKHATVKEVEAALRLVSGGGSAGSASPLPGSALPGTATATTSPAAVAAAGSATLGESNPFFGALRIMPIERINSILVVTPRAAYLDEARRWIDRLDKPSDGGSEPQLFIYPVQNGNARHLAGVLGGLFGGSSGGAAATANNGIAPGLGSTTGNSFGQAGGGNTFGNTSMGGLGNSRTGLASALTSGGAGSGGLNSLNRTNTPAATNQAAATAMLGTIRVVADDLNNSILVWGTRSEFNKIEATLKRLDLPLTQVLIDASIIEVTLDDSLQYGLQWTFSGDARNGYSGRGAVGGALSTAASSGFSYALSNGAGTLKATLSALASKSLPKMISNPSLMVLDNHTATIAVGDQVPVSTSTITSETTTVTSSTIQYKDTGVNLSVTPSVNAGNIVAMQIDQTVTDAGETVKDANNQLKFLQRQISSKVAVRSGESIVLGGLIKDNKSSSKEGVPLLKDIPLVGGLFAQNKSSGGRTELLVIITPRVVRSDVDIREVSEDLRERLKGLRAIEVDLPSGRNPVTPKVQSEQLAPAQVNSNGWQ